MRKLFAVVLFALLLGVGVVAVIETDPGYVLVSYGNYSLETSLWVGLLLILLLVLTVYLLLRLIYRIIGGQRSLFSWLGLRKTQKSLRLTTQGLISFTEGNWSRARRELLSGAKNSQAPLGNYLLAARSSDQLNDKDKVHEYLRAAEEIDPKAAVAVQITLAEMKLESNEYEQALAALESAKINVGRHPYVASLLYQIYQGLKDWDSLLGLLPELRKHKVLDAEEVQQLELQAYRNRLEQGAPEQVSALWQKTPKLMQQDAQLFECYVGRLIELGDDNTAEKALQRALKREWKSTLVRQYGLVKGADVRRQLSKAESWLGAHPQDAQLHLCLGRLSARAELWGKALDYFESSYRLAASAETCAELGRLLTGLGEPKVAAAYFREGLLLSQDGLPVLPIPGSISSTSETLPAT